jgi:hypothetical protein
MSYFQFLPGVGSVEDAAKGEMGNLSDDRTSFDGKYDLFDRLRGALGGYSEEDVREKAQKLLEKKINKTNPGLRGAIEENLPGIKPEDLKIQEGELETDYNKRLGQLNSRGLAVTDYVGVKGSDLSQTEDLTTQQIRKLAAAQRDANEQAITDKGEQRYTDALIRAEQIRADDRSDRREDRAMERELRMMELDQRGRKSKAELFQALFGLGRAFLI